MKMQNKSGLLALLSGVVLSSLIAGCSTTSESQNSAATAESVAAQAEIQQQKVEAIIVSGSRLKRDASDILLDSLPPKQRPIVNPKQHAVQVFKQYHVSPTISTEVDPISTFAMDVDSGSYSLAKQMLDSGQMPASAGIRVEEFINAFDYQKLPGDDLFEVGAQMFPSKFRQGYQVLHLNVQAKSVTDDERLSNNLVLVADTSGSMEGEKIELLKKAFITLVSQLDRDDQVSIVTYNDEAEVLLPPTKVKRKRSIIKRISKLSAGGGTNAEAGIKQAYKTAEQMFLPGFNNRVVLTSDGMANIGHVSPEAILQQIEGAKDKGIFLTTVGVGRDMYNDYLLEQLANQGNGHYLYFASEKDIQSAFVDELYRQLETVAKDAKVQVSFDPNTVQEYRLIGYENRDVADNRFLSESEDGGEIGSGHQVNAIYEIKLAANQSQNESYGTIAVAYKKPLGNKVRYFKKQISQQIKVAQARQASSDSRLAYIVAAFAEKLRQSYWAQTYHYTDLLQQIRQLPGHYLESQQVKDLEQLIFRASQLDNRVLPYDFSLADLNFDRVPVLD